MTETELKPARLRQVGFDEWRKINAALESRILHGTEKEENVEIECRRCDGDGYMVGGLKDRYEHIDCPRCKGTGQLNPKGDKALTEQVLRTIYSNQLNADCEKLRRWEQDNAAV